MVTLFKGKTWRRKVLGMLSGTYIQHCTINVFAGNSVCIFFVYAACDRCQILSFRNIGIQVTDVASFLYMCACNTWQVLCGLCGRCRSCFCSDAYDMWQMLCGILGKHVADAFLFSFFPLFLSLFFSCLLYL